MTGKQLRAGGWADGIGRIAFALLIIAVLLPSTAAAADSQTFGSSTRQSFASKLDSQTGSWYPAAMAAILVSIFAIALIYMAGEAFHAENLKRYARGELLQTVASALMIIFAVALLYEVSGGGAFKLMGEALGGSGSIGCAAAPQGRFLLWEDNAGFGSGPIGAFKCKTQERIDGAEACYQDIESKNRHQEAFLSFCLSFFGFPVFCNSWNFEAHQNVEENHLLATKLVSILIALHAEYALSDYVGSTMLSIFLPLGLVLRIFPFTRGVGGLLIAMAVSFYFVWPTFAVLSDPSLIRVVPTESPSDILQKGCFTGFKGAAVLMSNAFASTVSGVGISQLANESCTESLFQITVSTMFYPFVAFVVALIAVRALTPLLGGDLGDIMRMVGRLG